MTHQQIAIGNILDERGKQNEKWGEQNHHPALWMTILTEEVGEAAKEILEGNAEKAVHELIQVGAVTVAMIESILRNGGWPSATALQLSKKSQEKGVVQ